ncbi:MAG: hypothetical protein M1817_004307 [Caeruleum heppii]|nr:MAG: hypothetical protein M1817_004307 [Caeruleum heppii]
MDSNSLASGVATVSGVIMNSPIVARFMPWRSQERNNRPNPDFPMPFGGLRSVSNRALDDPFVSPSADFSHPRPAPPSPSAATLTLNTATPSSRVVYEGHNVAPPSRRLFTNNNHAANLVHSPASTVTSPFGVPSLPLSTVRSLPTLPTSNSLVELPGSILLDNRGYPDSRSSLETASNGRPRPALDRSAPLRERRDTQQDEPQELSGSSSAVEGRIELEGCSPISPIQTKLLPQVAGSRAGDGQEAVRGDGTAAGAQSKDDSTLVSQILTHRVQTLEKAIKERDAEISNYTSSLGDLQASHDAEMKDLRERSATEVGNIKQVLKMLEDHYSPANSPSRAHFPTDVQDPVTPALPSSSAKRHLEPPSMGTRFRSASAGSADSLLTTVPANSPLSVVRKEKKPEEPASGIHDSVRRVQAQRDHRKSATIREQDLARQLEVSARRQQELEDQLGAVSDWSASIHKTLDGRMGQIKKLEQELTDRTADVEELETQMTLLVEQVEMLGGRAARQSKAERERDEILIQIAQRDRVIDHLRSEMAQRLVSGDSLKGLPSPPPSARTHNALSMVLEESTCAAHEAQIKELKSEIDRHLNDIRLYKLDVKCYKKDVRVRDAKIRDLQQTVLDLQTRLGDKGGEILPVEVPLGIDMGDTSGIGIGITTPTPTQSKRASKPKPQPLNLALRKASVPTPPSSPNKPLPPSPRTPISKYNQEIEEIQQRLDLSARSRSEGAWRTTSKGEGGSPLPLKMRTG